MGNTASLVFSEDTKKLEITEKLAKDFQYHINLVDRSMTGFTRLVDAYRAHYTSLHQGRKEKNNSKNEDTDEIVKGHSGDAVSFEALDETLSDNKFVVLESLSKLFSFIIQTGNSCNIQAFDVVFSVDKYRSGHTVEHSSENAKLYDSQQEVIQNKLEAVTTVYELAKKEIDNLNRREEINQNEKQILQKDIKDLETAVSKMKKEVDNITNQKNNVEVSEQELRLEVNSLKDHIKEVEHSLAIERTTSKQCEKSSKVKSDEYLKKIESLEKEKTDSLTENDKLKKEIDDITNEKKRLEISKDELGLEVNNLKDQIKEIKDKLADEISARKTVEESSKIKLDDNSKKCEFLEREKLHRLANIDELNAQIKELKQENKNICDGLENEKLRITAIQEDQISRVNMLIDAVYVQSDNFKTCQEKEINILESISKDKEKSRKEILEQLDVLKIEQNNAKECYEKKLLVEESEIKQLLSDLDNKLCSTEQLEAKHKNEIGDLHTEKEKLLKEIKENESELSTAKSKLESKGEIYEVRTSIGSINDELKRMNKENYDADLRRLQTCLDHAKEEGKEFIKAIDCLKEKLRCSNEQNKSLEMQVNNLKETVSQMEKMMDKENEEMKNKRTEIEKLEQKIQEQEETIDKGSSKINMLTLNNVELSTKLQTEINYKVSLMEEKISNSEALNEKISKIRTEYSEALIKETELHIQTIDKVIKEKYELERTVKETMEDLRKEQAVVAELTKTDEEKKQVVESLELQLQLAKRKVLNIQVINKSGSHNAKIKDEVQRLIKMRMIPEQVDLQFLNCSKSFVVQSDLPLFIFNTRDYSCNRKKNISDVKKDLKEPHSKAALVFLHDKDEPAFRKDVDGSQYTGKPPAIFDFGHKKELHECETNATNVENIIQFIKAMYPKQFATTESSV